MSIQDFIARKKQELFTARDADKLEMQRAELHQRRVAIEKENRLREEVRMEQQKIREARSKPTRDTLSKFRTGVGNFAGNVEKLGGETRPGFAGVAGLSNDDMAAQRDKINAGPFNGGKSPFAVDTPRRRK